MNSLNCRRPRIRKNENAELELVKQAELEHDTKSNKLVTLLLGPVKFFKTQVSNKS